MPHDTKDTYVKKIIMFLEISFGTFYVYLLTLYCAF